jgi:hypothetical protein
MVKLDQLPQLNTVFNTNPVSVAHDWEIHRAGGHKAVS